VPSKGIVVGAVIRVKKHPNADYIRLVYVDIGTGEPHQIVFGGRRDPLPRALVAVAPPGSRLFSGVKMRRRHYRGQWSYGMLCSTDELGWSTDGADEIAVLRPGNTPGKCLDDIDFPDGWLDDGSMSTPFHGYVPNNARLMSRSDVRDQIAALGSIRAGAGFASPRCADTPVANG
jgi:tRNA-binding EMAP/Myf-like protein